MTAFVFAVLFGLNFLLSSGKGQIFPPLEGNIFYPLPGENVTITWRLGVNVSELTDRGWSFSTNPRFFARIVDNFDVIKYSQHSPGPFTIKKPSTLILENVNILNYNGTYTFSINFGRRKYSSVVAVFVQNAPIVNLSCPGRNEVNEGDNFTCECRGVGGNPPANVTWYKGVVQIGETKKENNTLNLYDVNATDSGSYTCVAQSYPTEAFKDEKSTELTVGPIMKPNNTNITFIPQPVMIGGSVEIKCDSEGVPDPHFIINGPNGLNFTGQSYIIQYVRKSDEGSYTCIATNALGNDSATDNLTVTEPTQTTPEPSTQNIVSSTTITRGTVPVKETVPTDPEDPKSSEFILFTVIMSLLGVVIIGILLSYIVWRSRRKSTSSMHESNPEPQTTEVDPTYQGLDLNKMNKEDNYQSLTGNYAASNDVGTEDESAYTELKKIRDVEDQYQSLQ